MIKVQDIMTEDVFTLTVNDSLTDARKLMMEHAIRHIPVVNDTNELVGLISQRDVLAAEESSLSAIDSDDRLSREMQIKISDFFHQNITTISPSAPVIKAALYMQKHKIGSLPVTVEGKLVGLITDSDFVNVAINLLELNNDYE